MIAAAASVCAQTLPSRDVYEPQARSSGARPEGRQPMASGRFKWPFSSLVASCGTWDRVRESATPLPGTHGVFWLESVRDREHVVIGGDGAVVHAGQGLPHRGQNVWQAHAEAATAQAATDRSDEHARGVERGGRHVSVEASP